jgi:hypothetical protein
MVVVDDERSISVKRSSLSLSLRPKPSPHPYPNLLRNVPPRVSFVRERSSFGAILGRLLYDSVSSVKVSFSAREVTSVLDWTSVIVAVGEYDAERARGDPA